jgi:hypothetical protein
LLSKEALNNNDYIQKPKQKKTPKNKQTNKQNQKKKELYRP